MSQKIGCVANIFRFSTISKNPISYKIDKLPINLFETVDEILRTHLPTQKNDLIPLETGLQCQFYISKKDLLLAPKRDFISGYIIAGNNGIDSEIIKPTSQSSYHRSVNDVELIKLHFLFHLAPNKQNAILLTQTLGVNSITRPFVNALLRKFREIYASQQINVEQENITLRTRSMKEYIKNGKIKRITATNFKQTSNISASNTSQARCELNISPVKTGAFSSDVNDILLEQDKDKALIKIKNLTGIDLYDFEDLKCAIQVGKTQRVIDVMHPENSVLRFDLSHLKREDGCHPNLSDLKKEEENIITELRQYID